MKIETVLTDEQIKELFEWHIDDPAVKALSFDFARDIEKTILQSEKVQALRKDAERLDWLESCEGSYGFCQAGYGHYIYYAHQEQGFPTVREIIDDAMEQQK